MKKLWKKTFFWAILITLILATVLFVNWKIESGKNSREGRKSSENKSTPNPLTPPNDDNPTENPEPKPPTDTENWWLGEKEIEHAYQEIRKEITDHPWIYLASPSEVRNIQEGGEISEELKKAKIIFFPINNPKEHGVIDNENCWTLLVYSSNRGTFCNYNSLKFTFTPKNAMKVAENFHGKAKLPAWPLVWNVKDIPRGTNNSDSGVYVIAYTRELIKKYQQDKEREAFISSEEVFIFTIAEERQKLKEAGFPKK